MVSERSTRAEELARIKDASGLVRAAASASGLPAEQVSLLDEYYGAKKRSKISVINGADRAKQSRGPARAGGGSSRQIQSRSDSERTVAQ